MSVLTSNRVEQASLRGMEGQNGITDSKSVYIPLRAMPWIWLLEMGMQTHLFVLYRLIRQELLA